jgi:uncharacterized pyridoxamine 5'-phosphate oxidase family protein
MDFEEYVNFANQTILCSVGTVEGDQPRVRIFGLWFADKDGFYFSTPKTGNTYKQLSANPKVELCFYALPASPMGQGGSTDMGKEMRVTGVAEFIDDPSMKERLVSERPFMRQFADTTTIFRVSNGEAWFWTFADSGRESAIERVHF